MKNEMYENIRNYSHYQVFIYTIFIIAPRENYAN